MKEKDQKQPPVIEQLREYASTYLKLAKYEAIAEIASILGDFIADIVQGIFIVFIIIFASLTVAFFLAHIMHSLWTGFGVVSVLYLLIFFAIRICKKRFQKYFMDAAARKLSKHLSNK